MTGKPVRGSNEAKRQAASISKRAAAAKDNSAPLAASKRCGIWGCTGLARGAAKAHGVGKLCTSHHLHYRRHGHATKASLTHSQLTPFRFAAFQWVTEHRVTDRYVANALKRIDNCLSTAAGNGRVPEAHELRGMSPDDKAQAVWARLARREIDTRIILSLALGVQAFLAVDPEAPKGTEYGRVQMGKVLNRLGGGTVWRHRSTAQPEKPHWMDLEQWPASHGLSLRRIGQRLEQMAEHVTGEHLPAIVAARECLKRVPPRPYPRDVANVMRKAKLTVYDNGPPPSKVAPVLSTEELKTAEGGTFVIHRH